MPVNYEKIREENLERYGWDIDRVAQMAFADSYADRTHFIFELLQNAEDAIGRRGKSWEGDRTVSFLLSQEFPLSQDLLRVSHYGEPFNEDDVRGICGIGETTKSGDYTTIGRFGVGFKSVYAFTRHPEVHSGDEDFVVEKFVQPKTAEPIQRAPNETVFLIPLDRDNRVDDNDKIAAALAGLDVRSFLFLRQIEELQWEVEGCDSGHYLREVEIEDEIARRVNVIGHVKDLVGEESDVNEEWIVFSRGVQHNGKEAGHVEIAFNVDDNTGKIRRLEESKLVVYFPTAVETRLGFMVHGPYRTTPNRDNVPKDDEWNRYLVDQTCILLKDALMWLRDRGLLDADVLRCLPLRSFPDSMLEPLFDATRKMLSTERLLPKFGGGYVSTGRALMGDSEAVRALLSEKLLRALYGRPISWLSGDFTVDVNPELRRYLMSELGVNEITPALIVGRLNRGFLANQSDEWMIQLYEFLATRRALHHRCLSKPLIRLKDGRHVKPQNNGQPGAYLPSTSETGFPTVHSAVCASNGAIDLLKSLGIERPDIVDDVIANVMPKYQDADRTIGVDEYDSDINRIGNAYRGADSYSQRQRLLDVLTSTSWVKTKDSGHGTKRRSKPGDVYLATCRLTTLFSTVSGFRFVDQDYACLRSDTVQSLLIECGAASNFRPIKFENNDSLDNLQLEDMRFRSHNDIGFSNQYPPQDWRLQGLEPILQSIDSLNTDVQTRTSSLLWESLSELDIEYFEGEYSWFYYSYRSCKFDSSFIELLNETAWVASENGGLKRPREVEFGELGWKPNEFLQSKIRFKTSEIEKVARKIGADPEFLDKIIQRISTGHLTEAEWDEAFPDSDGASQTGQYDTAADTKQIMSSGAKPFSQSLRDAMTSSPTDATDSPVIMPTGGPKTAESARSDTRRSARHGRSGKRVTREVSRFEPSATARILDEKFKNMLLGDYGRRCQICGSTFRTRSGDLQVFADHVVDPSEGAGTNHFGNLMSLCGWHYALISYGQWVLLDPVTEEPSKAVEADQDVRGIVELLEKAETEWDNNGNEFITLPVRFWNIYSNWQSDAKHVDQEIRFSLPHRAYLAELLKA